MASTAGAFLLWLAVLLSGRLVLLMTAACYVFPTEQVDPCLHLQCPPGAQCLPDADGRTATCQCPTR